MNGNARLHLRLRAAGWMAAVAGLFATAFILYLSYDHRLHIESIGLIATATFGAGISGYWIGWRLVDPEEEEDWTSALALGMATGLLAYPLCVLLYMAGFIIVVSITPVRLY